MWRLPRWCQGNINSRRKKHFSVLKNTPLKCRYLIMALAFLALLRLFSFLFWQPVERRMQKEEDEGEIKNPSVKEYQIIFFFVFAREYHDVSHFSNLFGVSIFNPIQFAPSSHQPYRISWVSLHMFGILLKLSSCSPASLSHHIHKVSGNFISLNQQNKRGDSKVFPEAERRTHSIVIVYPNQCQGKFN